MFVSGRRGSLTIALLAGTAMSSQALALDASGSAVEVSRITTAQGPGGERVLQSQGPVYMGDEIETNPNGLAQIRFVDDTKIVVGPNSRIVIDTFVFNPDNTAREITVDAVKGVFRFISGNSPSEAYKIRTPTMTIGVRGTVVDIQSHGAGSRVVFLQGSGEGCDAQDQCIVFQGGCRLYVSPRGGGFQEPEGLDQELQMSAYFPLIENQRQLDPAFRVDTSSCFSNDSRLNRIPEENNSNNDNQPGSPPPPPPPSPPPPSPPPSPPPPGPPPPPPPPSPPPPPPPSPPPPPPPPPPAPPAPPPYQG